MPLVSKPIPLSIAKGVVRNTWLEVVADFQVFIANIPDSIRQKQAERFGPIRVAILDDGVDTFADALYGKIVGGHSFCKTGRFSDFGESIYFSSAKGHGTAMAKLVCWVCSEACLEVVKLDGAAYGQPTAESAAEAINWAVMRGV